MRSVICGLLTVLVCLAAIVAASPASDGPFAHRGNDSGSCAGGQCAGGQCDNGQCAGGQCERNGKHRRPIDVNVNVSPTPVVIQNPPARPSEEKPAAKPDLGMAAVTVAVAAIFAVALLGALAAGFHTRAAQSRRSAEPARRGRTI